MLVVPSLVVQKWFNVQFIGVKEVAIRVFDEVFPIITHASPVLGMLLEGQILVSKNFFGDHILELERRGLAWKRLIQLLIDCEQLFFVGRIGYFETSGG